MPLRARGTSLPRRLVHISLSASTCAHWPGRIGPSASAWVHRSGQIDLSQTSVPKLRRGKGPYRALRSACACPWMGAHASNSLVALYGPLPRLLGDLWGWAGYRARAGEVIGSHTPEDCAVWRLVSLGDPTNCGPVWPSPTRGFYRRAMILSDYGCLARAHAAAGLKAQEVDSRPERPSRGVPHPPGAQVGSGAFDPIRQCVKAPARYIMHR